MLPPDQQHGLSESLRRKPSTGSPGKQQYGSSGEKHRSFHSFATLSTRKCDSTATESTLVSNKDSLDSLTEHALESTLQAQFAEQTAKEMADIVKYWDSACNGLSASSPEMPRNSLVFDEPVDHVMARALFVGSHAKNAPFDAVEGSIALNATAIGTSFSVQCPSSPSGSLGSFSSLGMGSFRDDCGATSPEYALQSETQSLAWKQRLEIERLCVTTREMESHLAHLSQTSEQREGPEGITGCGLLLPVLRRLCPNLSSNRCYSLWGHLIFFLGLLIVLGRAWSPDGYPNCPATKQKVFDGVSNRLVLGHPRNREQTCLDFDFDEMF